MSAHVELSRRSVLKGTGALVVSAAAANLGLPGEGMGAVPDPKTLGSWIALHNDGTVTVYLGKVELGQGNGTTLLQLVAEELDLDMSQVSAAQVDTRRSINQGATVSSSSIQQAGGQIRAAAAEMRQELRRRASQRLNVPVEKLVAVRGQIHGEGKTISYQALVDEGLTTIPRTNKAPLKATADYRIVGQRVPRVDIPAKVNGTYTYMQQVRVPGMQHGRVVRPQGQSAYGKAASVLAVDETSIADLKGVQIVKRGNFIGVVAAREWDAVRAAEKLRVNWDFQEALPGTDDLYNKMRSAKTDDAIMLAEGDVAKASAAHVVRGAFHGPYQAHAPFGPSCAIADLTGDIVTVQCSSQDVFALRDRVAALLKREPQSVSVQYVEGAGCFGHSCYDDAALAAVIMAQEVGKPVRVQFSRANEIGWDNYGPAHVGEVTIGADKDGRLVSYEYHGWHHGWHIEESTEELALGKPVRELNKGPGSLFVNKFVTGGMYAIPHRLLVNHAIAGLEGYLKGANLRAPMDLHYAFSSEQLIDQLAAAVGLDSVEFRRRNAANERWLGVLEAAAKAANWQPRTSARAETGDVVIGRGVALGTHRASMGAAVADIEVNRKTGEVVVKHVYAAMDCGIAVNPDIVESQIIGMAIQATSRMLFEEVQFSKSEVTSTDWITYPILRFGQHPEVTPIIVKRNDPPIGAGEEVLPAVGAAIANAFADATGRRLTEYPLTPKRVLVALRT